MFPFSLCMLYTVVLFRSLGRVPAAKVACQVTGDTAHAQDILTVAYRTTAVDDSLVATIVTSIYRVVDRTVANLLVVHHLYNLRNGLYVFLCFAIQLYVGDVSATCQCMERSLTFDFLDNSNRFFYVHMEGVDIIITVVYPFNDSLFSLSFFI